MLKTPLSALSLAAAALLFLTPAAKAIEIQEVTSPGGIAAWLVQDSSNPILALSFSFAGGAASDPDGQEGRAGLAMGLLSEGAGDLDAGAFRGELEERSIRLSFDAGRDRLSGSLVTLTAERDRAAELLSLALTQPRFDAAALERVRGQILTDLKRRESQPNSQAALALQAAVFPDHPYGRSTRGTMEAVTALSAEDLQALVDARLAQDNLLVGVVGDISAEELGPYLDAIFGGLPAEAVDHGVLPPPPRAIGALLQVELAVPQSAIMMAQPGPLRDDPDYYALVVVDHVLGGGSFTSRLFQEVREKRGLAYGVWSTLRPMDQAGLWYAGTSTQTARVPESLEVIQEAWRQMAEEGPSDAEIERAVDYLVGSFLLRLTSSEAIARTLVAIQRSDLGMDYLERRAEIYESLTPEEIRDAARRWLDPEALTVVVAGQPLEAPEEAQTN
ncbi:MAG: pitrilysin family protein [Pseudomonadota bacterium]